MHLPDESPYLLTTWLPACGCNMDPDEFRKAVVDHFNDTIAPIWSDDELKNRPEEAIKFCEQVRGKIASWDVPNHIILRTLTNMRKQSRVTP